MQTQLGSDVLRFLQFSCSSLGQQLSSEGSAWLLCEFIKKNRTLTSTGPFKSCV